MPSAKLGVLQERIKNSFSNESTHDEESDGVFKIPFHINKSGFPLDDLTWDRMWQRASHIYPEAMSEINGILKNNLLDEVPVPRPPKFSKKASTLDCIDSIQSYILSLTYNHTGTQLFDIKKSRSLSGLMETAKEMIRDSLPIKCLEAVVLGLFLTSDLTTVNRFPIGFKSECKGKYHYHIVLGLSYAGMYGSIGISRRNELMDKPLVYKNLSKLIEDFNVSYSKNGHKMKKVRIGAHVTHDIHSMEQIKWRCISVNFNSRNNSEGYCKVDKFSRLLRSSTCLPPLRKPSRMSRPGSAIKRRRSAFNLRAKRKIGVQN